jgi:colanic acid/amylovoran biosynthesis protein
VRALVKHQDAFTVIREDLHPLALIDFCGSMDIFIGTRMHSNIFALINSVPVVAVEYEHKTKGIMQSLGLADLTLNINTLSLSELKHATETILDNKDYYQGLIRKNVLAQAELSASAIEVIKNDYKINHAGAQ